MSELESELLLGVSGAENPQKVGFLDGDGLDLLSLPLGLAQESQIVSRLVAVSRLADVNLVIHFL